jgi:hypothetical protein
VIDRYIDCSRRSARYPRIRPSKSASSAVRLPSGLAHDQNSSSLEFDSSIEMATWRCEIRRRESDL